MIYLDSSVALARLFAEPQSPPDSFWARDFVSSRLLAYEVVGRVQARVPGSQLVDQANVLVDRVQLLDLSAGILARALERFPVPVRTLDALHLASMEFLRGHGQTLAVATYDARLAAAATALGFALVAL